MKLHMTKAYELTSDNKTHTVKQKCMFRADWIDTHCHYLK
jgi:hypothetical protein